MSDQSEDPAEIRKLMGDLHRQALGAILPLQVDPAKATREVTMVASDESVDSYGTIFRVDGWMDLRRGGVPLLLAHDRDTMPIGRVERLEKTLVDGRKVLLAHARIAPEGVSPEADRAYGLLKAGVLQDVSVGFDPKEIDPVKDPEERKRLGLPAGGFVFTRQALLELSVVSVPANQNATVLAVRSDNRPALSDEIGEAIRKALEASTISGGNREDASLRELIMLQIDRLDAIERAVQALGQRGIGGSGGSGSPKPDQAPKGGDTLYRALLDRAENLTTRATDDRRDPTGPGRQPGDPDA